MSDVQTAIILDQYADMLNEELEHLSCTGPSTGLAEKAILDGEDLVGEYRYSLGGRKRYATPLLGLREVVERLEEHVRHCPVGQYRVAEGGCWCE